MLLVLIILLIIIFYMVYNTTENFTCCDGGDIYKNMYFDKKQFENERRFGNVLSYELNPPYIYH